MYMFMFGSLGDDVTANPDESSFCKALLHARGTVTVLDSGAVSYKRVWCACHGQALRSVGADSGVC